MEQQIRLIASDLDGTLLRDDRTLSLLYALCTETLQDRRHPVFAVTARPPRALKARFQAWNTTERSATTELWQFSTMKLSGNRESNPL